jgi:hypothetical protein
MVQVACQVSALTRLLEVAQQLQSMADANQWRLAFIGGIALQRWGEPRLTVDVDAALFAGIEPDLKILQVLLEVFDARIENPIRFALNNRVVLLRSNDGIGIDIGLAAFSYEEQAFQRSSLFEFDEGIVLRTISAEDLVIMKALAGRDKDWLDVGTISIRQAQTLDWTLIETTIAALAELFENPHALIRLREIRSRSEQ